MCSVRVVFVRLAVSGVVINVLKLLSVVLAVAFTRHIVYYP